MEGLLYQLDELNRSMMASFRAAYVGFQSNPCGNADFLRTEVEKINQEQRRLRALQLQIRGFVEMARTQSANNTVLAEQYIDLVKRIGASGVIGETGDADRIAVREAMQNNLLAVERLKECE